MTEPKVASSDATNIESSITREGDHYVINGHKWWTSASATPLQDPHLHGQDRRQELRRYKQQSMILVPRTARHQRCSAC